MAILSNVVLFLAILVAIVFSLLVLITGKGDAMSGGGSVRTSYKGKATFDDIMSKAALYLGVSFMALVLFYNILSARVRNAENMAGIVPISAPSAPPVTNNAPAITPPATNSPASSNAPVASNNAPATNTPASNAPASNAPAGNAPAANNAPKK